MERDAKPGFLHLKYFRYLEHVGPNEDFQAGYRTRPKPEELRDWDPVITFQDQIQKLGCESKDLEAIQKETHFRVDQSAERAQKAPHPPAEELLTDLLVS
jgi:pyruvate dehydrogenase E1 component alpha subunit